MKSAQSSARASLAGIVLLVAYLCALPGLLPAVFATMARVEGSHAVEVRTNGAETHVLLMHRGSSRALSHDAIHRHCLAARLLASISQEDESGGPDHVVKFLRDRNAGDESAVAPEAPLDAGVAAPELALIRELRSPGDEFARAWTDRVQAHAPPAFLIELRSTLLLI